jgi:hypothetical protein
MIPEKRSLTPEKLIELLEKKGIKISFEDSEKVLNLLYLLANTVVDHKINS